MELLCSCSPYFESLFQSRYDEAITEPLVLPDEDPQVFAQVILWMYRGDYPEALGSKKMEFLVRLWILAGNLEMPSLQNLVMGVCVQRYNKNPMSTMDQDIVNHIYSHTLPESPMRCLAVDVWVGKVNTKTFQEKKGELSRHFLEDLCAELIKRKEDELPTLTHLLFEDRYLVHLSRSLVNLFSPKLDGEIDIKQTATAAQMNSRKLKPLRPRTKDKSGVSAATMSTTVNTEAGICEQHMAKDLNKLKIHK